MMTKIDRLFFAEALRMASKAMLEGEELPWLYGFSRELARTVLIHLKKDPISVEKICASFPRDEDALRAAVGKPKSEQKPYER